MISVKNLLLPALLFSTLVFAGCKDECKDVNCGANGTCVEGTCVCDAGYLGSDCGTLFNAKINGVYTASEVCSQTGQKSFPVDITANSTKPYEVSVEQLWNTPGHSVVGVLNTSGNQISIPKQDLGTSGYDLEVTSSTVSADGKSINLAYKIYIDDTLFLEDCTVNLTR